MPSSLRGTTREGWRLWSLLAGTGPGLPPQGLLLCLEHGGIDRCVLWGTVLPQSLAGTLCLLPRAGPASGIHCGPSRDAGHSQGCHCFSFLDCALPTCFLGINQSPLQILATGSPSSKGGHEGTRHPSPDPRCSQATVSVILTPDWVFQGPRGEQDGLAHPAPDLALRWPQ